MSGNIPIEFVFDDIKKVPTGYLGWSIADMFVNFASDEGREVPTFT
jgi:hypothetical protein